MVNYHHGHGDRRRFATKSLTFSKLLRSFPAVAFGSQRFAAPESAAFRFGVRYDAVMSRIIPLLALALASCAAPPPGVEQQSPPLELAGLAAGPPERCVTINSQQSFRTSDNNRHVLLYGNGRTIYANQLGQCRFAPDDILVTEPIGSQYCRGDIVRSFDRQSRIPGPACILGDFVPYTRR